MAIPIENIYYLLCYAWDKLEEKDQVKVSIDEEIKMSDLFAKILIKGCNRLLKRGIEKNYLESTFEVAGVKGKLDMTTTIQSGLHLKLRTICTVDEFSGNIVSNQIILSTVDLLLRTKNLDHRLKKELKVIRWMLPGIDIIPLSPRVFSQVRLHRNNYFYDFLVKICHLIYQNVLPSETPGVWLFVDFQRDPVKMGRLYEAFLFNFYKREFPQWHVRRENIPWQFTSINNYDQDFLPRMQTDITIETGSGKIIMDAKYYGQTMSSNYNVQKVHSVNLYQLFSYLVNQRTLAPSNLSTRGILVYPTVNKEVDLEYWYDQHCIQIKTVNLNAHWIDIDKRLRSIVALV